MSSAATDLGNYPSATGANTGLVSAEAWVKAFAEGWREPRGAEAFITHFREMLGEDVRLIQPQLGTLVGRSAFEERFARPLFALIPDLRAEVDRWAVNGEVAFIEITLRGTLGRRGVSWRACDRVTLREGVAVERESYFDPAPLIAAIVRAPRLWPRFVQLQLRARIPMTNKRRRTQ